MTRCSSAWIRGGRSRWPGLARPRPCSACLTGAATATERDRRRAGVRRAARGGRPGARGAGRGGSARRLSGSDARLATRAAARPAGPRAGDRVAGLRGRGRRSAHAGPPAGRLRPGARRGPDRRVRGQLPGRLRRRARQLRRPGARRARRPRARRAGRWPISASRGRRARPAPSNAPRPRPGPATTAPSRTW